MADFSDVSVVAWAARGPLDVLITANDQLVQGFTSQYEFRFPDNPDTIAPVIGSVSPASGSAVAPDAAIGFTVTEDRAPGSIFVYATIGARAEVVWNGSAFVAGYETYSTRSGSLIQPFSIRRNVGWPDNFSLVISAQDAAGNTASTIATYTVTTSGGVRPQVKNFVPAALSPLSPDQAIQFDLIDEAGVMASSTVSVYNLRTGRVELVHDGDAFVEGYTTSSRSAITNGYRYFLLRTGGWPDVRFKVRVKAKDAEGNTEILV